MFGAQPLFVKLRNAIKVTVNHMATGIWLEGCGWILPAASESIRQTFWELIAGFRMCSVETLDAFQYLARPRKTAISEVCRDDG